MPKRTNDFQHLIFRLHAALHGTDSIIEESALVENHSSGNREEIDVLITFDRGGSTYKTGIACRDHGRRAGPDWIRNLALQREHCRLDKVIAVHSRGFSEPAKKTAIQLNIETIAASDFDAVDWKKCVEVPSALISAAVQVRLQWHLVFENSDTATRPELDIKSVQIETERLTLEQLHRICHQRISDWCLDEMRIEGTHTLLPKQRQQFKIASFLWKLPNGSAVEFSDGITTSVLAVGGTAITMQELRHATYNKVLQYDDKVAIDAQSEMFGRGTKYLAVFKNKPHSIHMEPMPGSDIKFRHVNAVPSRRVPSPAAGMKIEWQQRLSVTCSSISERCPRRR